MGKALGQVLRMVECMSRWDCAPNSKVTVYWEPRPFLYLGGKSGVQFKWYYIN